MKEKEKLVENISKKERKRIPNSKIWNCLYCDKNCKWLYEANQTNQNPINYKIKINCIKGIITSL